MNTDQGRRPQRRGARLRLIIFTMFVLIVLATAATPTGAYLR